MSWIMKATAPFYEDPNLVPVFGVILYTDRHANVAKLLQDDYYWRSLHERSGEAWAIFATRIKEGQWEFPRPRAGEMGMMVSIWKEPAENKPLLRRFNLHDSEDAPCLVIFTELGDGDLLMNRFKIKDTSVDSVYHSLGEAVDVIARSINYIKAENIKNREGVFSAMNAALKSHKEWTWIKSKRSLAQWVASLIS